MNILRESGKQQTMKLKLTLTDLHLLNLALLGLPLSLPPFLVANSPAAEAMEETDEETDDDEDGDEEDESKVKKIPYLDFAARELAGETVNRSVLVDGKYEEKDVTVKDPVTKAKSVVKKLVLVSGKMHAIPADLNPEIHRIPGRKFWADETLLLKLKVRSLESKLTLLSKRRDEINDTITELESMGDATQRNSYAAAKRNLAASIKALQASGISVSIEEMLARLQKAKS